MDLSLREFLSITIEYLETEHIFFADEIEPDDFQFLEQLFRQECLGRKDVDRAVGLLSKVSFEERLQLEKYLLSGQIFDFRGK